MIVPEGKKNGPIILVALDGEPTNTIERLISEGKKPAYGDRWLIDKNLTDLKACVFDTRTKVYSDNSVYTGVKGPYIKKGGRRYLIKEFK